MKKIELKKIGLDVKSITKKLKDGLITQAEAEKEIFKSGMDLDYKTMIFEAVKKPPENKGADYDMERRRIKLLDKIDEATDFLEVTDEEYEEIRQAIKDDAKKYALIDRSIVQFLDDFDIK